MSVEAIRKKLSHLHLGVLTHRMTAHWHRAVVVEWQGVETPRQKIQRHIDGWKWIENMLREFDDSELAEHVVTRIDTLECLLRDF